jgi:acetyl esterase/lipase
MKKIIPLLLISLLSNYTMAQNKNIIFLWPGDVPGENKPKSEPVAEPVGEDNILRISEVTDPSVEVFLPEVSKRNNAAVVVCPGGGYRILAYNLEGTEIASWLNSKGYTAFVLKYRVPDKKEGALQDVQRALRVVKYNAGKWGIDPEKVGVMGFSAGGSLSARAATLYGVKSYQPVDKADSLSCRPAFSMLIYPAYLDLGPDHSLTPELRLGKDVPPIFIFQTADDQYGNSALVMARSMRDAGLPVELHLLPEGGHGYGLRPGKRSAETWPLLAEKWLDTILATNK